MDVTKGKGQQGDTPPDVAGEEEDEVSTTKVAAAEGRRRRCGSGDGGSVRRRSGGEGAKDLKGPTTQHEGVPTPHYDVVTVMADV